jgi:hypothetical protein
VKQAVALILSLATSASVPIQAETAQKEESMRPGLWAVQTYADDETNAPLNRRSYFDPNPSTEAEDEYACFTKSDIGPFVGKPYGECRIVEVNDEGARVDRTAHCRGDLISPRGLKYPPPPDVKFEYETIIVHVTGWQTEREFVHHKAIWSQKDGPDGDNVTKIREEGRFLSDECPSK